MTKKTVGLDDAARLMGISKEALRKRIKRGTVEARKGKDGRWQVTVDQDTGEDTGRDAGRTLVQAMQEEIEYLRRESERKDVIIMNLTNKIPMLEAPKEDETSRRREILPWWQRILKRKKGSKNDY